MNDQPHPAPSPQCTLTDAQAARIDYARRDNEYARAENLSQLPTEGLILLTERLRGRLDDLLQVIDEIST